MNTALRAVFLVIVAAVATEVVFAADPCHSGLLPGQRPGPYAFVVATGANRGKSHCFVCETADRPAVIIFARTPCPALGKLLNRIDQAVVEHQKKELRSWVTFLSESEPMLEPRLVEWSRQNGLKNIAVGVFEHVDGPPSYRLNREADVTILLSVKQKVVANFAFRDGELNEERSKEVMDALPKLFEGAK